MLYQDGKVYGMVKSTMFPLVSAEVYICLDIQLAYRQTWTIAQPSRKLAPC